MVETKLNFFLIGAPKGGTTHVHARLSRHPRVYLSPLKEPNHFATDIDPTRFSPAFRSNVPADLKGYLADRPLRPRQIGFVHDRDQYRLLFDAVRPEHAVVGECSTSTSGRRRPHSMWRRRTPRPASSACSGIRWSGCIRIG